MPNGHFKRVIEITLRHGSSLVNLLHIFRTLFPKSIFGELLLTNVTNISENGLQFFTEN